MRRLMLTLAVTVLMVAGCSSSEPLAFDLSHPMQPPEAPFTIAGPATDEGIVCPVGMWVEDRMEDMDGNELTERGWADIFDNAVATGSVAEARGYKTFVCGDDSGSITLSNHDVLDFGVLDIETFGQGETTGGTWTIAGTGDYESLSGSGDIVLMWDEMKMHYKGEVEG
ncbi:MAG: hypothetical protein QNL12_04215 [Acidimicrobiia bacterium]|nr:hypothetical protein [Acidimicrobiia bacterium]